MKTLKRLSQFRPQKANANKGNPRGLTQLDKSLRRDGYSAPMVAAADGEIFAGSKRLERAADVFGVDVEPIVVHSDGTRPVIHVRDDIKTADDPRAVRLGVADNAIAHMDYDPDGELLALLAAEDAAIAEMVRADELSMKAALEFTQGEPQDAEPQIDRAAELNKKWKVSRGDLWRIGEHRLLCGDSTVREDVERVMGGEKAMCLLTDPPYNVDYKGNYIQSGNILDEGEKIWSDKSFTDKIENFPEWLNGVYKISDGVMGNGCAIYIWHPAGAEGLAFWDSWLWDEWHFQVDLVWNKQSLIIARWDYKPQHEPCMYGWKGTSRKWTGANNESTVWDYPRQQGTAGGKREHPTEKPLPVFQRCISNHDAQIVVDPFSGSGTTLVACQNLSRRCRAIEISPAYCAVILQRMTDAFPGIEIERVTA